MYAETINQQRTIAGPGRSTNQLPLWRRSLLLVVIGYETLGCLAGGVMLMADPSGNVMSMPVSIMNGAFPDFFIPGMLLTGLGLLGAISYWFLLRSLKSAWLATAFALGGMNIWFWVEIAVLGEIHWLHLMWGIPVIVATFLALPLIPSSGQLRRNLLLSAGIIASVLYTIINVIVAAQWPDYDPVTMTVSELSAVGAPTRRLWMVLCTPYSILMVAFAFGVLASAGASRKIKVAGWLLIAYGITGVLWPFAPMHLRETLAAGGGTISDRRNRLLLYPVAGVGAGAMILNVKKLRGTNGNPPDADERRQVSATLAAFSLAAGADRYLMFGGGDGGVSVSLRIGVSYALQTSDWNGERLNGRRANIPGAFVSVGFGGGGWSDD